MDGERGGLHGIGGAEGTRHWGDTGLRGSRRGLREASGECQGLGTARGPGGCKGFGVCRGSGVCKRLGVRKGLGVPGGCRGGGLHMGGGAVRGRVLFGWVEGPGFIWSRGNSQGVEACKGWSRVGVFARGRGAAERLWLLCFPPRACDRSSHMHGHNISAWQAPWAQPPLAPPGPHAHPSLSWGCPPPCLPSAGLPEVATWHQQRGNASAALPLQPCMCSGAVPAWGEH